MTELKFDAQDWCARLGVKGPRAAEWLVAQGLAVPMAPNSWARSTAAVGAGAVMVARLGQFEFFLEDAPAGTTLQGIAPALAVHPPGVYPVLREDAAFQLSGEGVHEVLAQVCNVNFAGLALDSHPVIMTLIRCCGARSARVDARGTRRRAALPDLVRSHFRPFSV